MNETLDLFAPSVSSRPKSSSVSGYPQKDFDGETYVPVLDKSRLFRQLDKVRELMSDGRSRTLAEIAEEVGCSEASVSARLRDLRKPKFGMYKVERNRVGTGLFTYRITGRFL